jgi:hypothetical protein
MQGKEKEVWGCKVIHCQVEKTWQVFSFMKKEGNSGKVINVNQILKHISGATGVCI